MTTGQIGLEPAAPSNKQTQGEKLEGVAFTFCKVATVALLAQRFTLPIAAGLSSIFYVAAYLKGKHDTKCWLRAPLFIAWFWICVTAVWVFANLEPVAWHRFSKMLFPWLPA
jgi:hypothetical protein